MRATRWLAAVLVLLVCVPAALAGDAAPPAAGGLAFEPSGLPWAEALAKAKAEGKPVFADFTTEWCGWCRVLERETFSLPSVAAEMKAFVCVQVDAEKGEGPDLAKRYGVSGYPTLVVVDAAGEEVDRIVGYLAPEPFLKEIARIRRGEDTLPALRKAVAERPGDFAAAIALARKLKDRRPAEALALAAAAEQQARATDREAAAQALLVQAGVLDASGETAKAVEAGERLLADYGGTQGALQAVGLLLFARVKGAARQGQEVDAEAALAYARELRGRVKDGAFLPEVERMLVDFHRTAAQQALARVAAAAGDDPQALNEAAWTAFQMRLDLTAASAWARKAVDLSQRDPAILDTLANIEAERGNLDEAIELEEEALAKAKEARDRVPFEEALARFRATRAARAASGVQVVPATPLVPAPAKEPPPAPGAGAK